jgi:hypothetical protein
MMETIPEVAHDGTPCIIYVRDRLGMFTLWKIPGSFSGLDDLLESVTNLRK